MEKPWWKSRSIGVGALVILLGALVQFSDIVKVEAPGNVPGWMLAASGLATIILRFITSSPLK